MTHRLMRVGRLLAAAKGNRRGQRDSTMILLAYRHSLRASELVDLRWDQIDFTRAVLHGRNMNAGLKVLAVLP